MRTRDVYATDDDGRGQLKGKRYVPENHVDQHILKQIAWMQTGSFFLEDEDTEELMDVKVKITDFSMDGIATVTICATWTHNDDELQKRLTYNIYMSDQLLLKDTHYHVDVIELAQELEPPNAA